MIKVAWSHQNFFLNQLYMWAARYNFLFEINEIAIIEVLFDKLDNSSANGQHYPTQWSDEAKNSEWIGPTGSGFVSKDNNIVI